MLQKCIDQEKPKHLFWSHLHYFARSLILPLECVHETSAVSWGRRRGVNMCTPGCSTVHWDIAIDAEYNRISSIVENSIDEENNVDGGFSNLETHKNCYHLAWSAMYLVWLDRELHIAINLLIQDTINPVNIFHFIQNQADGIFNVEEYLAWPVEWTPLWGRLFNFQILVDGDWFLFGLIDSRRNTI